MPLGQRRAALRGLHGIVEEPEILLVVRDPLAKEAEAPERRHEKIVEVMGDTAGELADRIQFLGFEELRHRILPLPGAKLDPAFQFLVQRLELLVGGLELRCPLLNPAFEVGIQSLQFPRLPIELHEDPHLGAQDLGNDRDGDVIDSARRIAAQAVGLGHHHRRHEDDRRLFEPGVAADQFHKLETVLLRHADIDQDNRDVGAQEMLQRLPRRLGHEQVLFKVLEDNLVAQQLRRLVVHEKDVHGIGHGHLTREATCAVLPAAPAYSRAWPGNRRLRPPGTSPDRPSSPWRSAQ